MIVVRTPLRITLGGGGSDLETGEGFCIAAAIDKYVTVAVNNPFTDDYVLKYSHTERVKHAADIDHPILRAAMELTHTPPGVEVSSMADVPAGTGLGSSGAFTVAVLHALVPDASRPWLAAASIQIDIGQQDQLAATYGGIHAFDCHAGTMRPIITDLDAKLELYYTGATRVAYIRGEPSPLDRELLYEQALTSLEALLDNDIRALGRAFTAQWTAKFAAQDTEFHVHVNNIISMGLASGAYGGKLVGAGGGGFVLFAVRDMPLLHEQMQRMGLRRLPFRFDYSGSTRLL